MMTEPTPSSLLLSADDRGVVTVTLNRPAIHNAFDDLLIADLRRAFDGFAADPAVRVVILTGAGRSFSAGADLAWMQRMAGYGEAENHADALALAEMLASIATCPKPVIAAVQGAAFGGGVGLVAACDMAVASDSASFCLSEVRLGLIPATIAPHVMAAIGARAARRYMLTAERFDAIDAFRLGLVQAVVSPDRLQKQVETWVKALLLGGPQALSASKDLIASVAGRPLSSPLLTETAARIARQRVGAEGQEGLRAFLSKREPSWVSRAAGRVEKDQQDV